MYSQQRPQLAAHTCVSGCLRLIVQLRALASTTEPSAQEAEPQQLYGAMRRSVEAVLALGTTSAVAQEDARDAAYALAAFADETALRCTGPVAEHWMPQLLQLQLFGETLAGDGFFTRLDKLRGAPHRVAVLEVYYLCLLLGFKGRFAVGHSDQALFELVASVRQTLAHHGVTDPEVLSPRGQRPVEALVQPQRYWRWLWLPAGAVVLAVVLYLILRQSIAHQATGWVAWIDTLVKTPF